MFKLSEASLGGFRAEMAKLSAPNWHQLIGGAGAGAGMGAALGGIAGAGVGAVKSYRDARSRGEGIGGAVAEGAGGALGGVTKGALVGAGLGAGAGAVAGHLRPSAVSNVVHGEAPVLSSAARFGQRQVHGLTGWAPEGGIQSIRGGAYDAKERVSSAESALRGAKDSATRAAATKELEHAGKGLAASEKAEQMGLTSLPGIARSMKNNGVVNTLKADVANQWSGAGVGSKALMVGIPAMGAVQALTAEDGEAYSRRPSERVGKGEAVGSNIGQAVGGMLGSSVPIIGQTVLGAPIGFAGKMIGRGVDRLRGVGPGEVQ